MAGAHGLEKGEGLAFIKSVISIIIIISTTRPLPPPPPPPPIILYSYRRTIVTILPIYCVLTPPTHPIHSYSAASIMSRSYGIRRDFGLHKEEGGVFLPELQEDSSVATRSESSPNYHSTMPAYDQHKRGRGQHGKLNISSVDKGASYPQSSPGKGARHLPNSSGKGASYPPSSPGKGARFPPSSSTASPTSPPPRELEKKESSEAKEKKSRGWFGSNKKKKKSDKGGVPSSPGIIIEGVAKEESMNRSSPMLHIRSEMQKGAKDQFGRPQVDPSEPEEDDESRMQISYDVPVESTRGEGREGGDLTKNTPHLRFS